MKSFISWAGTVLGSLLLGALTSTLPAADPPREVWNKVYDSGLANGSNDVVADQVDGCVVTGWSNDAGTDHLRTLRYDGGGSVLWNRGEDPSAPYGAATGIAADASGNLFVTGTKGGATNDIRLVKYDKDGTLVWERLYDAGGDEGGRAVALDGVRAIYIAGSFIDGEDWGLCLVKYDSAGSFRWAKTYNTPAYEYPADIAVDKRTGVLYLSATTGGQGGPEDLLTMKYDTAGTELWVRAYDFEFCDEAAAVAVDDSGYIHVGATALDSTEYLTSVVVVTYNPDGTVRSQWTYEPGGETALGDLAVDQAGFLYAAVKHYTAGTADFLTVKLDQQGTPIWTRTFDSNGQDRPSGLALDRAGYVYVTGWYGEYPTIDSRTIRYQQYLSISGTVTGATDVAVILDGWVRDTVVTDAQGHYEFANLPCGMAYDVTPEKSGATFTPPVRYYIPLGTDKVKQDFSTGGAAAEVPARPQPVPTLSVRPGPVLEVRYSPGMAGPVDLSVYDVQGRKVATLAAGVHTAGTHDCRWAPATAGVYFVRLTTPGCVLTGKVATLR